MVAFTAEGRNFDGFKSEGLLEKHALATWNLGIIAAFARRQSNTSRTCASKAVSVSCLPQRT
jgi:hypothetical protein